MFTTWGKPNKIERTVIFELNNSETVALNEYFLDLENSDNNFAAILTDTAQQSTTFVFNGKRIVTLPKDQRFSSPIFNFTYLNVNEKDGYVVTYEKDSLMYINYLGTTYGPFDYILPLSNGFAYFKDNHWGRQFIDHDRIILNKKTVYYGHKSYDFEENNDFYCQKYPDYHYFHKAISPNGKNFILEFYDKSKKCYALNINDSITYIGNATITTVSINNNGNYAYNYKTGEDYYCCIDQEKFGPYSDYIADLTLSNNGDFGFVHTSRKTKKTININGTDGKNYHEVSLIKINNNGKTMYGYTKHRKTFFRKHKEFISIGDSILGGPYNRILLGRFSNSNKYIYCYSIDDDWYCNNSGKTTPIAGNIWSFKTIECPDGAYATVYRNGNTDYYSWNGRTHIVKPFQHEYNYNNFLELKSPDGNHTFYTTLESNDITIDGTSYQTSSPALRAWHSTDQNAFVWLAIEGRELVIYKIKLQ